MNIKFTSAELKQFPLLEKISEGMEVVATNASEYDGLYGCISEIRYGLDKETENECILEICVDFCVPEHVTDGLSENDGYDAMQKYLDEHYPILNGTSISEVIMSEDMLGFQFNLSDTFYTEITGEVMQ